jgi:hypothetical protein
MTLRDFLMFPYSFSLYPVLQCCLILMYNTKLSDAKISAAAKADLAKGIGMISRLRTMSNSAQRLYVLLKTVMSHKGIEVSMASDSEEPKPFFQEGDSMNSPTPTPPSTVPSRLSDVGRGGHSQNQLDPGTPVSTASSSLQQSMGQVPRTRSVNISASAYPGQYAFVLSDVMAPPSVDGICKL